MKKIYKYIRIKNSISKLSVESLIAEFNNLVGKRFWTSARAAHDAALIEALVKRGLDVSAIYDGRTISFSHPICMDATKSKVVTY